MTRSTDDVRPGVKVVRRTLADGSIRTYTYDQKPKPRSRALEAGRAIHDIGHAYTKSPEFSALSEKWQAATMFYLGILEDRLGWMTVRDIQDPRSRTEFYAVRDAFAATPTKADKLMGVLRSLLGWAYERRLIVGHHAAGIGRLSKVGTRAQIVWSDDQLAAALAHASPEVGWVARFAVLSAARIGDIRALRWADYRDGWLTFRPSKTAKLDPPPIVRLPVYELPPLGALLAEIPRRHDHIFTTSHANGPWADDNFQYRWLGVVARAGLADADLHFHDLRGTAITRLLEAGATDAEVASISGHVLGGRSNLRSYTGRTDALAISAYRKYAAWLADRPSVVRFPSHRKTAG